jgi:hypothetical protein
MTEQSPGSRRNIEAVLAHLGVGGVVITREEEDRCYGWDTNGELLKYVVMENWARDADKVAQGHHGSTVIASFREKVEPSLQVCFHRHDESSYFVEIDLDHVPPTPFRPDRILRHGFEVVRNQITGGKTDQDAIAELLRTKRNISV